jgi:hypothetical protein
VVALQHLVQRADRLDETLFEFGVLDEDLHERRDFLTHLVRVEHGDVASNVPFALQFPDTVVNRRRRQPHPLRHDGLGHLGIVL